jgi:hypothetical protein
MTIPLRHRCRNPRCHMKLMAPVENEHHAFCCRGCHNSFYLSRCLVCEDPMRRKTVQQKFGSGHARCRSEYNRFRHIFDFPAHPTSCVGDRGRSAHFTGLKTDNRADRPWRKIAGPELSPRSFALATLPLDRATTARIARANAKAVLIGPNDEPINLLGGYRFPKAPTLDLKSARLEHDREHDHRAEHDQPSPRSKLPTSVG